MALDRSCCWQLLAGCVPSQQVRLGVHHILRRIWILLNKNKTLVAELGILGKNHCQHSTSGACPSADPGMKSVGLSEDIKQYMMLER
jgi:hypothetical protein